MQAELNRKPSTVYFSDIVGYTRLMGKDENAAFELMKENLQVHQEVLAKYRGQLIKELGDGILAVFETSADALNAGLEIQKHCNTTGRYQLRIGLQSGEIIFDHGDIFGDAVNIASRIQSVGIPNSIVFSDRVCKETYKEPNLQTVKLGSFELKNVEHTLELHALTNEPLAVPRRADILGNIRYQERSPWKTRVGIGAIVLLCLALVYSVFWGDATWEKEKSVAVLPFANLSEKDFDYFPNALTENLIDQISKISSIKTISYSTMKSFLNPDTPLDSIAALTKVSTILKGSVENLGSGVRINLQLVDVEKNKNIWTESYIRKGSEIPQFQNELAREIAKILDARLTAEEATQLGKGETSNPEAYELLSKAKQLYGEGFENPNLFFEASALLKNAIQLDPNYALAYTLLAKTYSQIAYDYPDGDWYELSLDMSSKALELEPKLAEAFNARAMVYYDLGQYSKAKNSLETATAYFPNLSDAIGNMATIQFAQGNLEEAIKHQTKSLNLGPKASYLPYQNIGWAYKILGNYPEAHLWFNRSLEQNKSPATYELSAFTYIQEGKLDSALALAETVKKLTVIDYKVLGYIYFYSGQLDSASNFFQLEMASIKDSKYPIYGSVPISYAYIIKLNGQTAKANSILENVIRIKADAINRGYEDCFLPLELAMAYAIKNEPDKSLMYLQMAYERGWRDYFFSEYNPIFIELKKDSRYLKILSQIQNDLLLEHRKLANTTLERNK